MADWKRLLLYLMDSTINSETVVRTFPAAPYRLRRMLRSRRLEARLALLAEVERARVRVAQAMSGSHAMWCLAGMVGSAPPDPAVRACLHVLRMLEKAPKDARRRRRKPAPTGANRRQRAQTGANRRERARFGAAREARPTGTESLQVTQMEEVPNGGGAAPPAEGPRQAGRAQDDAGEIPDILGRGPYAASR